MNVDVFVENVKKYCAAANTKPTAACENSGAGKNMLTNLTKRGVVPSIARVQMLAQYLGCTVSDLLGEAPAAVPKNVKAAAQEGSGQYEEFARIFKSLTPENQNRIIAEMLKRQREQ